MTPLNMKIGQFNSCSCPFSAATKFIAAGQLEGKLMIFIFVTCLKKYVLRFQINGNLQK